MVEEGRHIQRIAGGEGEVGAEDAHVSGRGHRVFIALARVNGAVLDSLEKFALGNQLIGRIELDDHFALGGLVERLNLGLDDLFGESGAGVSLHAPLDGGLVGLCRGGIRNDAGCRGHGHGGSDAHILQKITSLH